MGGERPPSEMVIDDNRAKPGEEYRLETEGPLFFRDIRKGKTDKDVPGGHYRR